jgi:hypothetical protein
MGGTYLILLLMNVAIATIPPVNASNQPIGIKKKGSTRVPSSATDEPIKAKATKQANPARSKAMATRFTSLTLCHCLTLPPHLIVLAVL